MDKKGSLSYKLIVSGKRENSVIIKDVWKLRYWTIYRRYGFQLIKMLVIHISEYEAKVERYKKGHIKYFLGGGKLVMK